MGNTETTSVKGNIHRFGAEVSKVLKLMIHSLYTNKDIFLRELISNASDACDKLRYQALTKPELTAEDGELKIRLALDKEAVTLTVSDNGIGMSREELAENLGTIARSGTQEFAAQLTGDSKKDLPLIGQFGVGFYSAFMVADKVRVVSRKAGEAEAHAWESDGEGEYRLEPVEGDVPRGTSVTLYLRDDAKEYLDRFRLKHIVQTYSDHIGFPIEMHDGEGNAETLNRGSALWTRPKGEITGEQYREFYRHVSHTPEEPWLTLHQKAEGAVEYTALLFIPGMKPFDLFHPDRKRRVKLYIKRVFITEEGVELVPGWLRFLRGVIDSEDLPLNISRETLQSSPVLVKIREAVVKKVLSELKKKAVDAPEEFARFWENFGPVVKEGLCEPIAPKEQILEVCRFHSTAHRVERTGLEGYIERMREGQEHIYYLTGERLETLQSSPQLEGFRTRGVEVLLLSDHVDDFWMTVVQDYKGTPFKSVTRADIDLSAFDTQEQKEKAQDEKATPDQGDIDALLAKMREVLGEQVRDVRASLKLDESPACLAVEEGDMDIRLQRFLVEQKQLPAVSAKVLEVNPRHPIVKELATRAASGADAVSAEMEDIIWLLLDQARVLEGEEVADPAAFSRRLSAFVQRSLAA